MRMVSFVVSLVRARALPIVAVVAFAVAGLAGSVRTAAAETPLGADAALGYELAARLCSACHLIEPRHAGPVVDGVPTLMRIAATLEDAEIETLLLAPSHPVMPEAPLSRAELGHLVAYIRSLATD
jgi:mono/diheme cytochrome c family protein